MNDSRDLFLRLCGIDIADVMMPHRLLRLAADEHDPRAVEQAAARVLTQLRAAADRIPAPHLEWMTQQVTQARSFMLLQCAQARPPLSPPPFPSYRQPPAVPQPSASHQWQPNQPAAADPPVIVRPTQPRRRSGLDAENLMGIAGILVMLVAAGIGAKLFHDQWWKDTVQGRGKQGAGANRKISSPLPPPDVSLGEGSGSKPTSKPAPEPEPAPRPRPRPQPKGNLTAAFAHLKTALQNVRKGFFDEADLDAQKALKAAPDCGEAEAMRIVVGYVRQYPGLADEALAALNENDVVDLGPKYGRAAFISRGDDGSITFQVMGRPKPFPPASLDKIPGFRFRVTESFLDNENKPANDLILGAYHLVSKLDGDGNVKPAGAIDAARERWLKAAGSGHEQSRAEAGMLLLLLDKLPELEQAE